MRGYEKGSRVFAMSHTEDKNPDPGEKRKLFVFGEGVYVGDLLRPGTEDGPPEVDREAILTVFFEDDAVSPEESRLTAFSVEVAKQNGEDVEQARAAAITAINIQRARPMEDRVQEIWEATMANPCIHLDSGDVVWGFQCWWAPPDRVDHKFPEDVFERVLVPVPEGNGRWKE